MSNGAHLELLTCGTSIGVHSPSGMFTAIDTGYPVISVTVKLNVVVEKQPLGNEAKQSSSSPVDELRATSMFPDDSMMHTERGEMSMINENKFIATFCNDLI